jgi:hypothetical protein
VHFDPSSLSFTYQLVIVRLELAKCIANSSCAANVACLHTADECQVSSVLSLEMLADTAERICISRMLTNRLSF